MGDIVRAGRNVGFAAALAAYAANNPEHVRAVVNAAGEIAEAGVDIVRNVRARPARNSVQDVEMTIPEAAPRTIGNYLPGMRYVRRRRRSRIPRRVRRARRRFSKKVKKVIFATAEKKIFRTTMLNLAAGNTGQGCSFSMVNGAAYFRPILPDVIYGAYPRATDISINATGIPFQSATDGFQGSAGHFTAAVIHIRCTPPIRQVLPAGVVLPEYVEQMWSVGYKVIKVTRHAKVSNHLATLSGSRNASGITDIFGRAMPGGIAAVTAINAPDFFLDSYYESYPAGFCTRWPATPTPDGTTSLSNMFRSSTPINPWQGTWNSKTYKVLSEGMLLIPTSRSADSNLRMPASSYKKIVLPINKTVDSRKTNIIDANKTVWDELLPDTYLLIWAYNPAYPMDNTSTPTTDAEWIAATPGPGPLRFLTDQPPTSFRPQLTMETVLYARDI